MHATTKHAETPDAESRLWGEFDSLRGQIEQDRLALGRVLLDLKNLYSERANSGDRRLTPGHGRFETELKARGFVPRRARELINDYEAARDGKPTESEKRASRRAVRGSKHWAPSGQDWANYFCGGGRCPFCCDTKSGDIWAAFGKLLPYAVARTAYLLAAKQLHPDHGGSTREMQQLNDAWARVEAHYKGLEAA